MTRTCLRRRSTFLAYRLVGARSCATGQARFQTAFLLLRTAYGAPDGYGSCQAFLLRRATPVARERAPARENVQVLETLARGSDDLQGGTGVNPPARAAAVVPRTRNYGAPASPT